MAANDTSGSTVALEVFRYQPEEDDEPRFQTYEVPYSEDWVVLDALGCDAIGLPCWFSEVCLE